MIPRVLSILIIGFWLLMTGLLMRSIWFPADSRLNVVSAGAVFRLIAARGEPSHLDIYEDRKIVGKLSITPATPSVPPLPGDSREMNIALSGNVDLPKGILTAQSLSMKGNFVLNHEGELRALDLKLSLKIPKMELQLSQLPTQTTPVVKFMMGGLKVMDTSEKQVEGGSAGEENTFAGFLLGFVGLSSAELDSMRQQAAVEAAGTRVEARQGEFELLGKAHQGYILSIKKQEKTSFRLCVESTGQIVSIETPTSYHLLTDELNGGAQ